MDHKKLFHSLYGASTEDELEAVLARHREVNDPANWRPYGGNESNFGVVENQQASPIPALVEKLINSVDAMLMRRCLEQGIDPCSAAAPRSMEEAVRQFFPEAKNWDLTTFRKVQAEEIQILATTSRGSRSPSTGSKRR